MIFAITVYVQTLVTRIRGPVFMTAFRPFATLIVALMGFILGEDLHLVLENGLLKSCESPFWSIYLSGTHLTDKSGLAGFLFSVRSSIRSAIYLSKTVLR